MATKSNNANQEVITPSVLVGTISAYGCVVDGNSAPPEGWLLCDGSALSRETYAALFAVIGTMNGSGNGVDSFNLPDLRGKFIRGVDDGTGRDPDAGNRGLAHTGGSSGDKVGSIQAYATGLPAEKNVFKTTLNGLHSHTVPHLPKDNSYYWISGSHYASWNSNSPKSSKAGKHTHTINDGGDLESRPINLYVNYIIYYGNKS